MKLAAEAMKLALEIISSSIIITEAEMETQRNCEQM